MTKIIHMSDLHINKNNHKIVYNMIADIKRYQDLSRFSVVITGDFTDNNKTGDLKRVKEILNLLKEAKAVLVCPGNHDYFSYQGNGFFPCESCEKDFNKTIYGNMQEFPSLKIVDEIAFIGLNSAHSEFFASGNIGKEQLAKLSIMLESEEVKACRKRIIYLHHHAFDLSLKWWKFWKRFMKSAMKLNDSKKFLQVLKEGNVEIVLNGHKHSKLGARTNQGIMFFNGGSSSGKESRKGVSLIEIGGKVKYQERWNFYEEV